MEVEGREINSIWEYEKQTCTPACISAFVNHPLIYLARVAH